MSLTPFKKSLKSLVAKEAYNVGYKKIILSKDDPISSNLDAMTHGIMLPKSIFSDFLVHDDKDEIIQVVRGKGILHFKDNPSISVEAGDTIYIPHGTYIKIENPDDQELEAFFIRILI